VTEGEIAVIGADAIGRAIADALARKERQVLLMDVAEEGRVDRLDSLRWVMHFALTTFRRRQRSRYLATLSGGRSDSRGAVTRRIPIPLSCRPDTRV
jgi:3-hydroxyacyl-CoA dehydrogenase